VDEYAESLQSLSRSAAPVNEWKSWTGGIPVFSLGFLGTLFTVHTKKGFVLRIILLLLLLLLRASALRCIAAE
jgi:hypothetical protein